MTIRDLVSGAPPPGHFHERYKIPWHERGFSRRLLDEHLDQSSDAANRPAPVIDLHVAWIHRQLLASRPARILDLCCGPGFYTSRLARLGHQCRGIDFAPAAIAYARAEAADQALACSYTEADVREAEFGQNLDLAMMLYGEFNAFSRSDAQVILRKITDSLRPGGQVLLEALRMDYLQRLGADEPSWSRHDNGGVFSERPHLLLDEHFWDEDSHVHTDRYFVIDAETLGIAEHFSTHQGYTQAELAALLEAAGLHGVRYYPSLTGKDGGDESFLAIVAHRE